MMQASNSVDTYPLLGKGRYHVIEQVRKVSRTHPHIVLAAYDRVTWQKVMIKQINPAAVQTRQQWEYAYNLLCREVALLQRIYDPRIPRLLDAFVEGQQLNIILQYIPGPTLQHYLSRPTGGRDQKRICPQSEVIDLGIQVCAILCYLHGLTPPIIHRDVKPANIIRKPGGDYVLLDFGNSREFGAQHPLTETHLSKASDEDTFPGVGTSGYAPPEQYTRQSQYDPHEYQPAATTPISDLYSVGVVMHEMLTGHDPTRAAHPDELFRYPPLDEHVYRGYVHPELADLIEQLLEWDAEHRPPSAYEVAQRLQSIQWDLSQAVFSLRKPQHSVSPHPFYRGDIRESYHYS